MRRAALLALALLTTGPAFAEPMKIVEPDDGRASDQYWSPTQRVTSGRHLMEKQVPIGAPDTESGEAGWTGPAGGSLPSPVRSSAESDTRVSASERAPALSSVDAGALIRDERAANAICRSTDGTRRTQIACEQRAAYTIRLNEIGWCFGKRGDAGANMKWHRCTRISYHYGD